MKAFWIDHHDVAGVEAPADAFVACALASGDEGDPAAYFDLGVALSTGSNGLGCDYVEAHKWFNIAARAGHSESALCRADLADEMTPRQVAEAQRRAREWLAGAREMAS